MKQNDILLVEYLFLAYKTSCCVADAQAGQSQARRRDVAYSPVTTVPPFRGQKNKKRVLTMIALTVHLDKRKTEHVSYEHSSNDVNAFNHRFLMNFTNTELS